MRYRAGLSGLVLAVFLFAACDGDDSPRGTPTPAESTTATEAATAAPTATRTPKVEPTQRPTPEVVAGRKHVYNRGDTVRVERGILFLDPVTGGGVVWEGVGVSRSGTYVWWMDDQGRGHVKNTLTDAETVVGEPGGQLGFDGFSPDDASFAVQTGTEVVVYRTSDGVEERRLELEPGTVGTNVGWSAQNALAVGMWDRDGESLGVAVHMNGEVQRFAAGATFLEWSPGGRWLAAAQGDELVLIDTATGRSVPAQGWGSNPRWSANGQWVAVQADDFSTVRVFDQQGLEVLRVSGMCAVLGTPWEGNELHSEFNDLLVAIDGSTRPAEPYAPGPVTSGWADGGGVEMKSSGTVVAELKIAFHVLRSWPYGRDGIRSMTDDGRGVFVLGVGGRGFCEGVGDFSVELPPFD